MKLTKVKYRFCCLLLCKILDLFDYSNEHFAKQFILLSSIYLGACFAASLRLHRHLLKVKDFGYANLTHMHGGSVRVIKSNQGQSNASEVFYSRETINFTEHPVTLFPKLLSGPPIRYRTNLNT